MKRMNLRDVPDDVYEALVQAAAVRRQSLNAFVLDQLAEVAQVMQIGQYLEGYVRPERTGVSLDEATASVREVREAS